MEVTKKPHRKAEIQLCSQYTTARQFPGCCTVSLVKPDPLAAEPMQLKGNARTMINMAKDTRVFTAQAGDGTGDTADRIRVPAEIYRSKDKLTDKA